MSLNSCTVHGIVDKSVEDDENLSARNKDLFWDLPLSAYRLIIGSDFHKNTVTMKKITTQKSSEAPTRNGRIF